MAPNILNLKQKKEKFKNKKTKNSKKNLEFQNFIRDNFENVVMILHIKLDRFITIVKQIQRNIWQCNKKQISELKDEGIETQIFPWIEKKKLSFLNLAM